MIRTMDFQDSNRDGIDDRDQDQFGRRTRFPGQPFQPELGIQDRLGGIADMIRAGGGRLTPPRFPGGQPPVKNYREQVIGRMPRPEFGRDTIPMQLVTNPAMTQGPESQGPFITDGSAFYTTGQEAFRDIMPIARPMPMPQPPRGGPVKFPGRLPVPPRGGPARPPIGIPGFPERPPVDFPQPLPQPPGRFPQPPGRFPQPPGNRFPQPQPPGRFPQPPGRFPQPFPQPGRKGQRNMPQPAGYYRQPPSSPMYPGQFPSPGRKGNRGYPQQPFPSPGRKGNQGSYQQPQMPFGYGQMTYNPYQFSGYGRPQNMFGFDQPHYQPYQPPQYNDPYPMPSPQPTPQPGPAPYPDPGPMPGPGPGGPGKGRSPGGPGKGNSGPIAGPAVEPPVVEPLPTPAPPVRNRRSWFDVHEERQAQAPAGDAAAGGKMRMGGQTAYPSQNLLSSYMMG